MGSKKRNKNNRQNHPSLVFDEAQHSFNEAIGAVQDHPIFAPMMMRAIIRRGKQSHTGYESWWNDDANHRSADGYAVVTSNGVIHVHPTRVLDKDEWIYILVHALLHLGFGHFQKRDNQAAWNAACDVYVARFAASLKFGRPPEALSVNVDHFARSEDDLYAKFCEHGIPVDAKACSLAGSDALDMIFDAETHKLWSMGAEITWDQLFARGLTNAVAHAVDYAAGVVDTMDVHAARRFSRGNQIRNWFVSSYPLLAALAAAFDVIEDPKLCQRMQISVAAVDAEAREIYVNPAAGLNDDELKFVMAHELLHVALRHHARRQGRDPYLWNVACDYVINQWLLEMNIGTMPQVGSLHDPNLNGLNAEAIYDIVVQDLRRYRKLMTLRGNGLGDMLEPGKPDWWTRDNGASLDDFYRRALAQGMSYCENEGRGFLPAGLIEEIRALTQPPIPWDVELAQWFDAHFPPTVKMRTYARPSRRQASTPDIPRPRYVPDPRFATGRTFGVVIDTSGSMSKQLIGKALGAIASYSISHEVGAIRVVFCDAHPYDQGYLAPEDIAHSVKVKGRGGTVLMPGINLLLKADDFPEEAPLLIITDGECDRLVIPREHAYLMPEGRSLPFPAKGTIFRMK